MTSTRLNTNKKQELIDIYLKRAKESRQTPAIAFEWLEKAYDLGSIEACYQIGDCRSNGFGVRKSKIRGMRYYYEAANKGHFRASGVLAVELLDIVCSKVKSINNGSAVINKSSHAYSDMADLIIKAGVVKEFLDCLRFFNYAYDNGERTAQYYFNSVININDWTLVAGLVKDRELRRVA
jgi:hypothetical protein